MSKRKPWVSPIVRGIEDLDAKPAVEAESDEDASTTIDAFSGDVVSSLTLKVKRLNASAVIPAYQSAGAACFDISAEFPEGSREPDGMRAIAPGRSIVVGTGLAFEVPEGYVMLVYSRSGHGFKAGVRLANSVGVIDSDFRGELKIKLQNDGSTVFEVKAGDRIAQAMLLPVPRAELVEVEDLTGTVRGAGGFGSTGA